MIPASSLAFISNLGGMDLIVIGLIGLLIFGKRLPEVGKNLGQAIVGFKKGLNEAGEDVKASAAEPENPYAQQSTRPAGGAPGVKASTVNKPKKMLAASEEP